MGLGSPWDNAYITLTKVTILFDVYKFISKNPPKHLQVLTQLASVPLGPML